MKTYEEPTLVVEGVGDSATTRVTHPAFGQIRASRCSGNISLYGSDLRHHSYIEMTIRRSEMSRSHSRNWHSPGEELISVALSEAQWATFISTMNVFSGAPCTITGLNRKMVPSIPDPVVRPHDSFADEVSKAMAGFHKKLQELADDLPDGPLTKKKVADLASALRNLAGRTTSEASFVAESFDEYMADTTEAAKAEVHAYVTNAVMQTGLASLLDTAPSLPILDAKKEED